MEDLTSTEHIDRLPILISGVGVKQLLGVPRLQSGTTEAQATDVIMSLEEWGIMDRVAGLCFDTNTVLPKADNDGGISGACTIIEQRLGRNLLFLACHHHMAEPVVWATFEGTSGASTGPEILLYKRCWRHDVFICRRQAPCIVPDG